MSEQEWDNLSYYEKLDHIRTVISDETLLLALMSFFSSDDFTAALTSIADDYDEIDFE